MHYTMTQPCSNCPFLKKHARAYSRRRLEEFAAGEFPCHKTAEVVEPDGDDDESAEYVGMADSLHCAGALIYNERRNRPHQMARIVERLGLFDSTKLDMAADVR